MELVRNFPAQAYQSALKDWAWLEPVSILVPAFTNALGDVFLEDDAGAVWFLDTITGTIEQQWPNRTTLQSSLASVEAQEHFFSASLVQAAHDAGLVPGPSDVLSFKTPPVLGGQFALDNLEIANFEVALSLAGQIHNQVRHLTPGTAISGIAQGTTDSPAPPRASKRKFWKRNS